MSKSSPPPSGEFGQTAVGVTIKDRYRIEKLERVEAGYFAYRAVDLTGGRPVLAYQVVESLARRKGYLERFQMDVRKLQRLSAHPAFPEVVDSCSDSVDQCYLITGYPAVTDVSLAKQLDRGVPLPLPKALHCLRLLIEALEVAHREGLCHYHLSPERILLSDDKTGERTLVLHGFGILQRGGDALPAQSGLEYLTPEQLRNESCDARTDQFVLAAIAYEMLSGRKAFAQRQDTPDQIRERVLREDPIPIPIQHPRESHINRALNKAFAKARQQRHASVREFCTELGVSPEDAQPRTLLLNRTQKPPPRRGMWIGVPAVMLLTGAGVALILRGPSQPKPIVTSRPDLSQPIPEPARKPQVAESQPDAAPTSNFVRPELRNNLASSPQSVSPPVASSQPPAPKAPPPVTVPPPPRDKGKEPAGVQGDPKMYRALSLFKPANTESTPLPVLPPKPPAPERSSLRATPPIDATKRGKLESCLRGYAFDELVLVKVGTTYRVSADSPQGLQRSRPLHSCLESSFRAGDLPDPLSIKREKK